jgi:F-type H+-transporting ATPase subunit a
VLSLLIVIFLVIFFSIISRRLKIYPSMTQYILEAYVNFINSMVSDLIGEKGKRYIPCIGTLGIFILLSNLLGLIPGLASPTSNINVTGGCAIFIFIYYHWQGLKEHGLVKYLRHFMGPIELKGLNILLAFLIFPVELIGHFSRPLSLSIRLFGNIFGEDLVILILFSLIPLLVPLPIMCLAIFTSVIQALVFVMLSTIYIAGAVESMEHH